MNRQPFPSDRRESGQATVEVAISLLAIAFVTVGILFVGGLGITSIKVLLSARTDAETLASRTTSGFQGGSDIGDWNYTDVEYQKNQAGGTVRIPFLATDESFNAREGISTDYFYDRSVSVSERDPDSQGTAQYDFRALEDTTGLSYPTRMLSDSSFDLANLEFSSGRLPDEILRYGSEQNYLLHRSGNEAERLRQKLALGGWFDFRPIDVLQWRSNRVAYPAFAPSGQ